MDKYYELSESRGAALAGGILFALPIAGGLYRGSFGWAEVVVALIGLAGLAASAKGALR